MGQAAGVPYITLLNRAMTLVMRANYGKGGKAVGLVKTKPHQKLARPKAAFRRMNAEERAEFVRWLKAEARHNES
jgi:hypothetical protein